MAEPPFQPFFQRFRLILSETGWRVVEINKNDLITCSMELKMKNIAFVLIVLLTGCSQISNELHPWQSRGDAFNLCLDVTKWETINKEYIGFIGEEYLSEITR
jgi:hypothetical protein